MRAWTLVLLLALAAPLRAATVTVRVTRLPAQTPPGAVLTLGANLNGWDPGRPGYAFAHVGGAPALRLELAEGTLLEFKVTRGSWSTVEKRADGGERDNRRLLVAGDTELAVEVEAWADQVASPPRPSTLSGRVDRLAGVWSPQLRNRRDVFVSLPPGYADGGGRYPVLYMHDGQNVFDAATGFGGREWRADEAAQELAARGLPLIVVAVASPDQSPDSPARLSEYGPFPVPAYRARGHAGRYADFLARTLKPLVDARYRTLRAREATGLAGSSMGGLVSLYAGLRHGRTFGFLGAFSPSLWFAGERIFPWVRSHPPRRGTRVYLDLGTREGDTLGEAAQAVERARRMAELLRSQGAEVRLEVEEGAGHDEDAWARRFPSAVEWWLTGWVRGGRRGAAGARRAGSRAAAHAAAAPEAAGPGDGPGAPPPPPSR